MEFDFDATGVGIVRGQPWKDALIKLLDPRSPYRPWKTYGALESEQPVVVVLDTDPRSVLTAVVTVGSDGDVDSALAGEHYRFKALLELSTLNMLTDLGLGQGGYRFRHADSPEKVARVFDRHIRTSRAMMSGHSTLAAARILLASEGRCAGCGSYIDLTGENARDRVHIHTISPDDQDWPAVLCDDCHEQMRDGGFTKFLDFRFSMNPVCPQCSAQRTQATMYGMPAGPVEEPWVAAMGCCVEPYEWHCSKCRHQW